MLVERAVNSAARLGVDLSLTGVHASVSWYGREGWQGCWPPVGGITNWNAGCKWNLRRHFCLRKT